MYSLVRDVHSYNCLVFCFRGSTPGFVACLCVAVLRASNSNKDATLGRGWGVGVYVCVCVWRVGGGDL